MEQHHAEQCGHTQTVRYVGPYVLGSTIGTGSTAKVKMGVHSVDGSRVAIKIINKNPTDAKANFREKVDREVAVLKLVDHPHILKLIEVFEGETHIYIITEMVQGGEFFDYLVKRGRLDQAETLQFFQQIIMGVEYCHSLQICHRDLKPENLLLDEKMCLKIADFGMAKFGRRDTMLETSCGSPHYASPQVVMGVKYNGMQADVWSCGVILFAMITGRLPFDDPNIKKLLAKVKQGVFVMPEELDVRLKDLISRMLTFDPDKRITIDGVKKHPWFLANGGPPHSPSIPDIQKLCVSVRKENIDSEVISDIRALGWGDDADLTSNITCAEKNVEKVIYHLLLQKKKQKREPFELKASRKKSSHRTSPKEAFAGDNCILPDLDSNRRSSPIMIPLGDSPTKQRGVRTLAMRREGKDTSSRHVFAPTPIQTSGLLDDDVSVEARSPGVEVLRIKDRVDEGISCSAENLRHPRRKMLPEINGSPLSSNSPKSTWASGSNDSFRSMGEFSASSMARHHASLASRKAACSKNFGILINRRLEDTIHLLEKCLKDVGAEFQLVDEVILLCRVRGTDASESELSFLVSISNVIDESSHLVKFQRQSDNLAAYDELIDKLHAMLRN